MNNSGTRVLLISNSTLYGSGYLDHAESEIRDFLGNVSEVLFVPYALCNRDAYAATAQERFQKMESFAKVRSRLRPCRETRSIICLSRKRKP